METVITLQDAANIATFVAPGYVALQVYAAIYAKQDKDFPRLLVESVAISFPAVAFTSWLWELARYAPPSAISAPYALLLLLIAVVLGVVFSQLRIRWPLKQLAERFGFGEPDKDFVRAQFSHLAIDDIVTLTLKNGEIVSGIPVRSSGFGKDAPREYYFINVAWYDKAKGTWDNRPGGLILNLEQVAYIETP